MLRRIILIVALMSLCWIAAAQTTTAEELPARKKYVQILSSYTYEDEWDTSIAKNICSELKRQNPEISVTVSYAGIGNLHSFLTERFAMQGAFSSGKLNATAGVPDVLVLIGDESWMFYRIMDLRGLWEKVPLVLCGMSAEIMNDYSRFFPNRMVADSLMIPLTESLKGLPATGVIVEDNTAQTIGMMKQLIPDLHKVVFLSNHSYQDVQGGERLQKSLAQYPGLNMQTCIVHPNHADSIQQVIAALPAGTAVVTNLYAAPAYCPVPVFSLRDSESKKKAFVGSHAASIQNISIRTAQLILRLYAGESAASIPFVKMTGTPLLNKGSVIHFGFETRADQLSGVVYRHIPPPFMIRHIRQIAFWILVAIVLSFSILIYVRSRVNSRRLNVSFKTFKQLYDKYQMVYRNMPIGLLSLDEEGNLLQRNEEAEALLEQLPAHSKEEFNLFHSDMLNQQEIQQVRMGNPVTTMRWFGKSCFRCMIRPIKHEKTGENNFLMVVTDHTEIEQARIAKEKIHEMLNFAMDASALGVAEYNLVDRKGFATRAWNANMGVEANGDDFICTHDSILPEYREKVEACLERIRLGGEEPFFEVIEVQHPSGEKHWLRYLVQLMEYAPDKDRMVVVELTYNIDAQVDREKELTTALRNAREADRLKNAFIANMRDNIRVPLDEIIRNATLLTKEKDPEEMRRLNERIEHGNQVLLGLINQLIDVSKKNEE